MVTLTKEDFNFKTKKKPAFGNEDGHVAAVFLDLDDRHEPFIVLLFHAIMAFRRLIKRFMRRKYVIQISKEVRRGDNPLQIAIKSSNIDLVQSRGRATVIKFDIMHEAITSNAAEIARKERWERNINNYIQKKQRTKKKGKKSAKSNTSTINLLKHMQHAHELGKGVKDFTETLKTMGVNALQAKEEISKKEIFTLENTLLSNPKFAVPPHAEKVPKFMIADVDSINTYLPGAPIYYGATIGIQARHGGYLSYFNSNDIKASAFKPTAQARYVVINCDRREDTGLVRYGDAVWLQVGLYEVLGAKFGMRKKKYNKGDDNKMDHSLMPTFINCRNENLQRAMNYGRWIIMSKNDSIARQGQPVCHHDQVLFEQEWYYLSSARPSEAAMFKSKAADHLDNEKELCKYLFKPAEECSWKIHILGQPTEKSDKKQLEKVFSKANKQMDATADNIHKKGPGLLSHIQTKIADHLKPEVFLVDNLKHKTDIVETQVQYYDVYQKLANKNFSNLQGTSKFLGQIYGKNSKIAQYSKIADNYKKKEAGLEIEEDEVVEVEAKKGFDMLSEQYWDVANKLLVPCVSALQLNGFMDEYFEIDHRKKYMAGMVIKRVLMRKLASRFTFPRALARNDNNVQSQLYSEGYATMVIQKESERMKLENTANYMKDYEMSAFNNDVGPLKLKKSTSPERSISPTKSQNVSNQSELPRVRPQTATSRINLSMQETIPDYQLPITRPKSATVSNQRQPLTRPVSASAIIRNAITSPIKLQKAYAEESSNMTRGHSAPAIRQTVDLSQSKSPKSPSKKESMRRLVKAAGREYGLPSDVFDGHEYSNSNTLKEPGKLKFLSRSSSTPEIYSEKKRRGINWTRKL